ncbi:hypothetical protein [Acidithrix sp. C25]|uniref:hypothetical protein n=1 Tax=Acidithrix sp. C25 TaxID=1671482 RepID=UPI0020C0A5E5|nr:hypothetical protein [Acidithrix sp. C25]
MPVAVNEVRGKPAQYPRQHSRGEVRPALARENAESLVVRHIAQSAELDLGFPADIAIPRTKAQRSRPEADQSDNAFVFRAM